MCGTNICFGHTSWIHQISCFSVVFDIISLRILISLKLNILFNLCLYTYYSIPVVTWHALYTCKVESFFIFPTQQTFFTICTCNYFSGGNFCLNFSFLKKTRFVISVVLVIRHTITSIFHFLRKPFCYFSSLSYTPNNTAFFHTVQEKTLVNN